MTLTPSQKSKTNNFCVPYALALLTGKSIDDCVDLLKEKLGDQPIAGIFFPVARRILIEQGFECTDMGCVPGMWIGNYMLEIPGHMIVVSGGIIYDNGSHINNRSAEILHPRMINRAIKVEKGA